MKKLLLFFAMCTSLSAWAQTVDKVVSDDGKTLTLVCSGDVSGMPDAQAPTGKKIFTAAAREGNQYGKVLTNNGDMASYPTIGAECTGTNYYLTVFTYSGPKAIPTTQNYFLKQNVYQFDGTSNYALKTAGSSVESTDQCWEITGSEEIISGAALDSYKGGESFTQEMWEFATNESGWRWQGKPVSVGSSYQEGKYYSTSQYDLPFLSYDELKEGKYLGSAINDDAKELYIVNSDNSYTLANGKLFNASLKYVKGISFTAISDITSSDYTTLAESVSITDDTWRKKVTENGEDVYYPVFDGDSYDAIATYVQVTGTTASEAKTVAELEAMGFVTDQLASMDFWTGIGLELLTKKYSKVVMTSSSSTKAVISDDVVHKLLFASTNPYNSTLSSLDLGDVVLPELNGMTFDPSEHKYMLKNIPLRELTLPLVLEADGEVSVPSYVLECATQNEVIKTVHIPEGYTKISDNAFRGLEKVQEFTLPSTLKEIGNSAFYYCGGLKSISPSSEKNINLPTGLEVIGKEAFVGTALISNEGDPLIFPSSVKKIGAKAFFNVKTLKFIQFSEGLEFVANSAFMSDSELDEQQTLVFPKTIKYLGPGSFVGRMFKDVFFTSVEAPICPIGKPLEQPYHLTECATFSPNLYHGNNGFNPAATNGGDDAMSGYANRENYINGGEYLAFLHYPVGLTEEQHNKYEDVTRIYETYPAGHQFAYDDPAGFDYNTENAGGVIPVGSSADEPARQEGFELTLGGNVLSPGFVDTFRGEQYIWPSQNMWARAFIESAFGYQYDGKTKYRPELTPEQIQYMIEDELIMRDGVKLTNGSVSLSQEQADVYNATLPGAISVETVKIPAVRYTDEEVNEHNADVSLNPGAVAIGDKFYYTAQEIADHNADWGGAKKENDVKVQGHDCVFYSWTEYVGIHPDSQYEWQSEEGYNSTVKWAYEQYSVYNQNYSVVEKYVKEAAVETQYYSASDAAEYNATNNPDAWTAPKEKGTVQTQEEANAYNASLEGAWRYGKVKEEAVRYTADEAKEENAKLTGAKSEGSPMSNLDYYEDYLRMIAYLGTREFVFSDPDTDPGTTPEEKKITGITAEHWWTLCVPFNMTRQMIDDTFGPGTHVCRLSKITRDVKSNTKSVKFFFQDDVYVHKSVKDADGVYTREGGNVAAEDIVIYAHEAYMIYPTVNQDEQGTFVVKNYKMETGSPIPTILEANADDDSNDDHTEYRYVGNYTQEISSIDAEGNITTTTAKIPTYSYMYAKKSGDDKYKFWFTTSDNVTWKPFKCVIQATAKDGGANENYHFFGGENPNASKVKQISIFGENEDMFNSEETDIEKVEFVFGEEGESETLYNLNGQMVNPNSLHKGVFIKNGKKILVK